MLVNHKTRRVLCTLLSLAFIGGPLDGEERNVRNPFADETYENGLLPNETQDILNLFKRMETLPEPVPAFEANSFLRDSNRLIGQMEDFRSDVMSRSSELNDKFDELEKLLREHPTCLVEDATPPVADKPPEPTPAPLPSAVVSEADAAEPTSQCGASDVCACNGIANSHARCSGSFAYLPRWRRLPLRTPLARR